MGRGRYHKTDALQRLNSYLTSINKPFTLGQVYKGIRVRDANEKARVAAAMDALLKEGRLSLTPDNKYRTRMKGVEIVGTIDMTGMGFAFLESEDSEVDIFIPPQALNHALHGDTVKVFMRQTARRPEGEVMEILQRARTEFVGVLRRGGSGGGYLNPDSRHMHTEIAIPPDQLGRAKEGQKVLVAITDWPANAKLPLGRVVDVLGNPGENNAEMHAILAEYGLPYKFDPEVEQAAREVPDNIADELPRRRDFREATTLTIDPKDAKDFDDALSLRKLPNGRFEVGVHIADVTHYVTPGSVIDQEAVRRATSVYLVDRTVPMLPERLSNGLCSLRPLEEKLTFSAVFELDENAVVQACWLGKTVIMSNHRFSYEEVQDIIDSGKGNYSEEILALHALAQKLRQARFANGSVGFERAEARFDIDQNGKPIGVYFREDTPSHQLIEEFMLLANRSVAEHVGKPAEKGKAPDAAAAKPKTFVYRVHENPNEQKLQNLSHVAQQLGYKVNFGKGKTISRELNRLLGEARGSKAQNLLEVLALRCMAKAQYSTKNVGHYGLAFDYYAHFTSPIRRYPDMLAHRLLESYLAGGKSAAADEYEQLCKHSSAMEGLAADAERASIKYKMAEYMQDKVGQEYAGVISGVTERGIYVEISENKIEGMVMLRTLKSDYFYFDEVNYRVVGRHTGKTYTLGDAVRIKVDRVNMEKKQLDYTMTEEGGGEAAPQAAPAAKAAKKERRSRRK